MTTRWILWTLLLAVLFAEPAQAQRHTTYPQLVQQNRSSPFQEQTLLLPSGSQESLLLYTFRVPYERLPFRRSDSQSEDPAFESELRMDLELREDDRPVARESWVDTVRTSTYEETREASSWIEGSLSFQVPPGQYHLYHAETSFRRTPGAGAANADRRRSGDRNRNGRIAIQVPESWQQPRLFILKQSVKTEEGRNVTLMNMGPDARYGEPYTLMVLTPPSDTTSWRVRIRPEQDGSTPEPLFETSLNSNNRFDATSFELLSQHGSPEISIRTNGSETGSKGWTILIPNENWPSRPHRIELLKDGEDEPVAHQVVTPRWPDMPVSLLNLDVAIDMLRFILPEDPLREIKRGSAADREQAWLAFWKERDPTPETEYNELMVEYYRRIDHAWENYTTPEQPGYNSDQGRTWIRLGPPERTERRYPPGQATRERWYYPDRIILFEATTGFGDFRRVGVEDR